MDLIATDDAHFSNLLAKLPPDLLNPPEDAEEGNSKFYKNHGGKAPEKERKEALLQRKEASKRARRARYDVDGDGGGDGDASDDGGAASDDGDDDGGAVGATPALKTQSEDLDVLRSRLRERLEGLSGGRGGEPKRKKKTKKQLKAEEKARKAEEQARRDDARKPAGEKRKRGDGAAAAAAPAPEPKPDLRFASLRAPPPAAAAPAGKVGAPGSKTKKLKTLIARAEKDKAQLAALKASGDAAGAEKLQWADALRVASGAKAPVDTTKLKKALKMREKKKAKSQREWKKREKGLADAASKKVVPSGRRAPREPAAE